MTYSAAGIACNGITFESGELCSVSRVDFHHKRVCISMKGFQIDIRRGPDLSHHLADLGINADDELI